MNPRFGLRIACTFALAAALVASGSPARAQHGAEPHPPAPPPAAATAHPAPSASETPAGTKPTTLQSPAAAERKPAAAPAAHKPVTSPSASTGPKGVSVASVVEKIQERIEKEVLTKRAARPGHGASHGASAAGPSHDAKLIPPDTKRISLEWRLTLDWPSELR
jgi:hypothetical protein